ncbi:MAG: hypothetical protein EOP88_09970 [Verrucomicrobiaceae bacterium]|nr:MAG: hypothetical protein EOP88_09970 [Verrucomicrobiaceae bacterium]
MKRIVIIGNSGSGKTFLARALAVGSGIPVIHLDEIFWQPGGFNRKRLADETDTMIHAAVAKDEWTAEGVFGNLAEKFLPRATHLIWLDLSWDTCHAGLLERGSESSRQQDPAKAEENFQKLLTWAAAYQDREGDCSQAGHLRIFEIFSGTKTRITERDEIDLAIESGFPLW